MALSVAVAAPLGPQSDLGDDGGLVTLAKSKGGSKGGSGGGGKGGKGGKHHRRHGGSGVYIGVGYCATIAAECADEYGLRTRRYYRCLRAAGC
jgi:hypothetical protein